MIKKKKNITLAMKTSRDEMLNYQMPERSKVWGLNVRRSNAGDQKSGYHICESLRGKCPH